MRPWLSWRNAWFLLLSLALAAAVGFAPAYIREIDVAGGIKDVPRGGADAVRWGTVIGTLGALRSALPDVEKTRGLKYDVKDFRDSTAALLALDQGELDIASITTQHLVRAMSEGMDVVWVAGWGGGYNVVIARKGFDAPMENDADLAAAIRGRRQQGNPVSIGVPTGSMQHAKLLVYLKALGIDPEHEVQIVNIPFPNHPRAMEAGEVDMIVTTCVFGAIAIDKGDARLVRHMFSEARGKQEIGFVANGRMMRDRPEFAQRVVSSLVDAMDTFMDKADVRIALERKYSRLPDAVIDMQERRFLKYDYRTNVADIKTMAKELRDLGWVNEDYSDRVDRYVDFAFLAKATGQSPAQLAAW
jgi:NitT/TauT family transport system substrate-binding protein